MTAATSTGSPPLLPEPVRAALSQVGERLDRGRRVPTHLAEAATEALRALPPDLHARGAWEVVETARLWRWRPYPSFALFAVRSDLAQLRRTPALAWLFLFHQDGHVREAALRLLDAPAPGAFLFVALAARLNDWAAPVRAAATACAGRCFPATAPEVVADAAPVLLLSGPTWGRWTVERAALSDVLARPDVAERLADRFAAARTGPTATLLRASLRSAALDRHLARIARDGRQPAVRAVALETLIDGEARWPASWRWRWIDKSMGVRRRETRFEARAIADAPPRLPLIRGAAADRSAAVRRAAAAGLIRHMLDDPDAKAIAATLRDDRSRAVRERAAFILERG